MMTMISPSAPQRPKLLDRVRLAMRAHHYSPRTEEAYVAWIKRWVFPATSTYVDRETGKRHRHHLHESVIQRAVKEAVRRAGVAKPATPHTFRHSGVYPALCGTTHLLEDGYDIRTVPVCVPRTGRQELLGHKDVSTTMI